IDRRLARGLGVGEFSRGMLYGAAQADGFTVIRTGMGATLPGEAEEFCAVCGACHPSNQTCRLPPFPAPDEGLVELITRRVMQTLSAGSSPPGAAS
ncbi:MAG: hypothetical protein ACE5G8_06835, partial [Anaerolineae bacterium]